VRWSIQNAKVFAPAESAGTENAIDSSLVGSNRGGGRTYGGPPTSAHLNSLWPAWTGDLTAPDPPHKAGSIAEGTAISTRMPAFGGGSPSIWKAKPVTP
jgi:hypothetical protein